MMDVDALLKPVQDVIAEVKRKFREAQHEAPLADVVRGFVAAIDWKEPWLIALLSTWAALLVIAVLTRRRTNIQAIIFAIAACLVYFGERLNGLAAEHSHRFSTQNYFDVRGVFYTACVSLPLLLVCFTVLVNYLLACSSLLIQTKRKELQRKARQQQRKAQ